MLLNGWAFSGSPLTAVILIALVDAIGAAPTIRKAFNKPYEEGVSPFILANVKWLLSIYALEKLERADAALPGDDTGRFSYQTQVSPPYQYFQAFARLPGRTYPASLCQPSILPYACVGISTTRDTAQSNVVRVVAKS